MFPTSTIKKSGLIDRVFLSKGFGSDTDLNYIGERLREPAQK